MSAVKMIRVWRNDPVKWAKDVLGVELDEWQKDAMLSYRDNPRTALIACKGPGKSAVLALCCWHFLDCFPHPKIAATSISEQNLADGLWAEMSKWQQKSVRLSSLFVWNKRRIFNKEFPETWWMSARTWAKDADATKQADTLAGLHADFIMFAIDEGGGIPSGVVAAADAALANDMGTDRTRARIMMAGNPTHVSGPLYDAANRDKKMWHCIHINSDPDDPKRTPRVSADWARAQIDKYGRDNPWVLVNVFGQFPPSSMNSLIGISEVREAAQRAARRQDYIGSQKRLGMDCAREGDDSTVLFPRQGLQAFPYKMWRNLKTFEQVYHLSAAKAKWGSELEFVDNTGGFGSGTVDGMLQQGVAVQAVHFSEKAMDSRYANARVEMYFRLVEWIRRGGCIPNDEELIAEIAAPEYTFDKKGRLILQPKDEIKIKLGRSPDRCDALMLTFFLPEQEGRGVSLEDLWGKEMVAAVEKKEYDPFHDY